MRRSAQLAWLVVPLFALPACGSSSPQPSLGQGRTVVIGDNDRGHTVDVHKGDVIQLVLHSTYWQPALPMDGAVVAQGDVRRQATHTSARCVPGAGCGTVSATYVAERDGQTLLTATRATCGEAMRCVGDNGAYEVTVRVTG